jgi:hypothetical protein
MLLFILARATRLAHRALSSLIAAHRCSLPSACSPSCFSLVARLRGSSTHRVVHAARKCALWRLQQQRRRRLRQLLPSRAQ